MKQTNSFMQHLLLMKKLILILLLLDSLGLYAQHRSEQQASLIAREFFMQKEREKLPRLKLVSQEDTARMSRRRASSSNEPTSSNCGCYIFNDEASDRFVIISADERMFQILGYSDNGMFDIDSAPDALIDMIDEYNRQYSTLFLENTPTIANTGTTSIEDIPIMIETEWGQGAPYNGHCPVDEKGETCATGCVATAMAQVMYYHRWPDHGSGGVVSYLAIPYITSIGQSLDFDELTIDWHNILTSYKGGATKAQEDEIAKLMHACGVSVYMDYGSTSGADDPNIPYAMINNFGYNPNIYYAAKKYYENGEWHQLVQEELKAGRPILYSSDGGGGHQFILDGMKDGMYHFNFGWNGKDDGYFLLDAITPGWSNYTSNQAMIVGVTPNETGEHKDVFYTNEFKLDTIVSVGSKSIITSFSPFCFCSEANTMAGKAKFHGEYGVGVFDKDFNFVRALYTYSSNNFVARSYQGSYSGDGNYVSFPSDLFEPNSQYYIAPYAKGKNSEKVTLMRTEAGRDDWYRVDVQGNQVFLKRKMKFDGDSIKNDEPRTVTLTLRCSAGGYLAYNDVTVTNETRTFQVVVGDTINVGYGAFEGYAIDDGPTFGTSVNTKIGQDSLYCTIYGIKSNTSVSITFAPINSQTSQQITLSADMQTFCPRKDLDFTGIEGLKAYIASGFNPKEGNVLLSSVTLVPAKTGLLLVGTAGQNYEVPFAETDFIYSNLFRGLLEDVEVTSGYVLDGDEFVAVDGTVTVKGGEAYLNVEPAANASRLTISFTDTIEISGIGDVVLDDAAKSGVWYTLQGTRLEGKPNKQGVYLHQGRKVVVK